MSDVGITVRRVRIDSVETLREAVAGADLDVVQLNKGKLTGALTHVAIGNFCMSVGRFSTAVRSRGVASSGRTTFAMLLNGAKSGEGHHVLPGDIGILPPGAPHESIYNDGASYVAISLVPSDVDALFDAEAVGKEIFKKASRYRLPTSLWRNIRRNLVSIVEQVESGASELSPGGAEYLQRALQDVVTVGFLRCMPPTQPISISQNVQLFQDVENYMETAGTRPVHVSELCGAFHVSRRTMHRAFQETIGTGPIAYLQRKRLCAVQAILCRSEPGDTTVSSVALEHGFFELGRFSEYYKSLFGENPSETLRGKVRRS